MRPLRAAVEPLALQHQIHRGRARHGAAFRLRPVVRKRICVGAAALEARPGARRERGRLVEEEQSGVAVAPDRVTAALELQHAANPLPRGPAAPPQSLVVAMETPTSVAEE